MSERSESWEKEFELCFHKWSQKFRLCLRGAPACAAWHILGREMGRTRTRRQLVLEVRAAQRLLLSEG